MSEIKENYKTPGHPTAFSAPGNLFNFYDRETNANIKKELSQIYSYTLHRDFKRPKFRNPYEQK